MVKNEYIQEWFNKGRIDIEEAEFLLKHGRSLEVISFHIQQGIEKFLKGYLIYQGWELEKTHDLRGLLSEATKIDKTFEKFIPLVRKISRYYIESRYPFSYKVDYTRKEMEESLKEAKEFIISLAGCVKKKK